MSAPSLTEVRRAAAIAKPCTCWVARVALHEGHCCFRQAPAHTDHAACHEVEGTAWRSSLGMVTEPIDGPDCLVCHPIDGPAVSLAEALAGHRVGVS